MINALARASISKINYGFVVLNYNNYKDTIACVESILQITHREDYRIVVVDNASPNISFDVLQSHFSEYEKVSLVLSKNNDGYSAGNNIGIRVLLGMGIEQVIIATNDTELISKNILEEFSKLNLSDVGIIGADILTAEGSHQNPTLYRPTFLYCLNMHLYEPMVWLRACIYRLLPSVESNRRSSTVKKIESLSEGGVWSASSVYMLHGSFLCLTKSYLNKVGLLDENVFMYGEEDLMSWNCERHGLKRLYLPAIKILHKDGQSTKDIYKEGKDKFVRTMTIKSKNYLARNIGKWFLLKLVLRYKCEK